MVKSKKGIYTMQWRPLNPDKTPAGGPWINQPKFKYKEENTAWKKFQEHVNEALFVELRLLKDGKELVSIKR